MEALRHLAISVPRPDATNRGRRLYYHDNALIFCTDAGVVMRAPYPRLLMRPHCIYRYTWLERPAHELRAVGGRVLLLTEDGSICAVEHSHDGVIHRTVMRMPAPVIALREQGLMLSATGDVYEYVDKAVVRRIPFGRPMRDVVMVPSTWMNGTYYYGVTSTGALYCVYSSDVMPVPLDHPVHTLCCSNRQLYVRLANGQWRRTMHGALADPASTIPCDAPALKRPCQDGQLREGMRLLRTDGVVYDAVHVTGQSALMYFFAFVLPATGREELHYLEYAQRGGEIGRYLRHVVEVEKAC